MFLNSFRFIGIIILALLSYSSQAQDEELTRKQISKQRPKYWQSGLGINIGNMRDFATSPITYRGVLANYSTGYLKMDTARETKFTIRFNHGAYHYSRTDGVNISSRSSQYILFLNYYRLYELKKLSNSKWNYKLGGMADVTTDVRVNPDLLNAGIGYEVFNTFALSAKVTRRFERKETVEKKFLFIKYRLRPRIMLLSYRLNVPVMNNVVRNGFAYIANEGINGIPLFKEYEAKAFSGFRISSELAYTYQLQNGNMFRLSYFWDAYMSGKDFNRFEAANHIIECSLLFHLNKNMQ